MKNFYEVSCETNDSIDTYWSCIVLAENEAEAHDIAFSKWPKAETSFNHIHIDEPWRKRESDWEEFELIPFN